MADQDREVKIVISAKNLSTDEFSAARKQLLGLGSEAKEVTRDTKGLASSLAGLKSALVGAFTVGSLVSFGKSILEAGDRIKKMADQTSLTTDEVQRLDYIASQSGTTIEGLVSAVQNLQQRLGAHDKGAIGALAALNINLEAFQKLGTYDQMITLAEGIRAVRNPTEQANLAAELFGKTWKEILPAIKSGMKELGDQAPIMAKQTVEALDRAGDAMARANLQAKVWGANIVLAFEGAGFAVGDFLSRFSPEHFGTANSEMLAMYKRVNDPDGLKGAFQKLKPPVLEAGAAIKAIDWSADDIEAATRHLNDQRKTLDDHAKATAAVTAKLNGLRDQLTGRGGIKAVEDLRAAMQGLPPVAKLTREGHEKIIEILSKNAAAYDQLGARAGKNLRQILADTLALVEPTAKMGLPGFIPGTPIFHEGAQLEPIPGRGMPFGFGGFVPWGARHIGPEPAPGTSGLPGGWLPGRILGPELAPGGRGFFGGAFGGAKGFSGLVGTTGLSAIMGGGNPFSAITSSIGSALTGQLAKVLTSGAGTAISGMMGGALNAILPGIGALAGPLLGKLFGGLFGMSKGKKENLEADKQSRELQAKFLEQIGGKEKLAGFEKLFGGESLLTSFASMGGGGGKKGFANIQADIEGFSKKVDALKGAAPQIQSLVDRGNQFGVGLPERFQPFLEQMKQLGLLQGDQGFNWQQLQDKANKYGIDIAGLGGKFQSARLHDGAKEILDDYDLLVKNGADVGAVLAGMSDEISALVVESIKFGVAIPENMRPMIEQLAASGQLLDENGNKMTDISGIKFGEPIKAGLDDVVERLDKLLEGLGIKLPEAVKTGVDRAASMAEELARRVKQATDEIPREIPIHIYKTGDEVPEYDTEVTVRGAAAGGLFAKPALRVIAERQPELVGSPRLMVTALADAMRATGFRSSPEQFDSMSSELRAMRDDISRLPIAIQRAVRDGMLLAA